MNYRPYYLLLYQQKIYIFWTYFNKGRIDNVRDVIKLKTALKR